MIIDGSAGASGRELRPEQKMSGRREISRMSACRLIPQRPAVSSQ